MSNPIPQMVDISHALQSTTIEKIRSDIKELQQVSELSAKQVETVDRYMESLKTASAQFAKDNEHVERGTDSSITSADMQLYSGLKAMYTDYLSQLATIRKEKTFTKTDANTNIGNPLEHMVEELPYLQPTERKSYIDNLILGNKYDEKLSKSSALLEAMVNLCVLDSTVTANLRSYITLLKRIGFSNEELKKTLPSGLLSSPLLAEVTSGNESDTNKVSKRFNTDREGTPPLKVLDDKDIASQKDGPDDEPKKKISFSKYLKKGDVVVNENGKRRSITMSSGDKPSQALKKIKKRDDVPISSILRVGGSGRKNSNNIKFVEDSLLVRVYGDGLPNDGLFVPPEKLRKVLKPFKEGEPREIVYIKGYSEKAPELDIEFDLSPEESDITETRGGPIPCETVIPLKHRLNFTNFSPDLGSKPPREPVVVEEPMDSLRKSKGPLIVRAFGKNSLLLRKDRGGLPYRSIPEVIPIDYPPRAP